MKAETFFNNGFGEDCEKVHRNHVIELMQNYAEHYHNEQLRIAVVVPSASEMGKYRSNLTNEVKRLKKACNENSKDHQKIMDSFKDFKYP